MGSERAGTLAVCFVELLDLSTRTSSLTGVSSLTAWSASGLSLSRGGLSLPRSTLTRASPTWPQDHKTCVTDSKTCVTDSVAERPLDI